MEAHATTRSRHTFEEYLQLEADTGCKHEYHAGQVYAMSGGTIEHATIGGNIFALLRAELRKKGNSCRVLNGDAKVYIATQDVYVYPDAMVICGGIEPSDQETNAVTNPTLVVEVLSKSTADYDRGDKFHRYRQLPSLQEYVLIEQDKAVVETFSKQAESGLWRIDRIDGLNMPVELCSVGVRINTTAIYEDVSFSEASQPGVNHSL